MADGRCLDCRCCRQEWSIDDGQRIVRGDGEPTVEHVKNMRLQLDTYCDIFDVFVPDDGFCWLFEREVKL